MVERDEKYKAYKKRVCTNIKLYNEENNTNYKWIDFKTKFRYIETLEKDKEYNCMCDHPILYRCIIRHIEDETEWILGSCCIKKFCKMWGKTCDRCFKKHKNIKDNYCNDCRIIIAEEERIKKPCCKICNKQIDIKYKYCYNHNPNINRYNSNHKLNLFL